MLLSDEIRICAQAGTLCMRLDLIGFLTSSLLPYEYETERNHAPLYTLIGFEEYQQQF